MQCSKSYQKALVLKEKGNDCFKKRSYPDALKCYSEAIFLAPWPSNELAKSAHQLSALGLRLPPPDSMSHDNKSLGEHFLAICFGNRSAALYEFGNFQDCLSDIEQALKLGVPGSTKDKLIKRKQRCNEQSKLLKIDQEQQEELLTCNVFESSYVTVKSSTEKGRFIESVKDIKPGTVIAKEEPFAAVLEVQYRMTHCSFCFGKTASLIPCCWCVDEGYCSDECRCRAWARYHWVECMKRPACLRSMESLFKLCLRTAIHTNSGLSSSDKEMTSTNKSNYSCISSLITHDDKFTDDSQKELLEELAQALTVSYGDFVRDSSLPPKELFLHLLFQLRCNTHSVSTMNHKSVDGSNHLSSNRGCSGTSVESLSEDKLGSALYPTLTLINHSCQPNAILRFIGNTASLCATRLISAREEVNISYGPQVGRSGRLQRQAELKSKYFFNCLCEVCKNAATEVQDALLCPSCSLGPVFNNEQITLSCVTCNHTLSKRELDERQRKRMKARQMFNDAVGNETVSFQALLECQRIQTEVLHKHNMELAKTNDGIAQAYAQQGDFVSSASYCDLSCQAVEVAYGNNSIELGNELCKLAHLLFNSNNSEKALTAAEIALTIIKVHYGSLHPDCLELNEIIKHC